VGRELVRDVLEGVVYLIVFAMCLLGVPIMMTILLCQALGISLTDPRAVVLAMAIAVPWLLAYAVYCEVEIEAMVERCMECCKRGLHEVRKRMELEDEVS